MAIALALGAVSALPAWADSTSSASSAATTSVGSSSTSIETSSKSSSGTKEVAQGPYQLIEMAEVVNQPNMVRLHLQAKVPTPPGAFFLVMPRDALQRAGLEAGHTVQAEHRPYGLAFSKPGTKPFFLVLEDDWHRELTSQPVTL